MYAWAFGPSFTMMPADSRLTENLSTLFIPAGPGETYSSVRKTEMARGTMHACLQGTRKTSLPSEIPNTFCLCPCQLAASSEIMEATALLPKHSRPRVPFEGLVPNPRPDRRVSCRFVSSRASTTVLARDGGLRALCMCIQYTCT